jgi:hypothetical protein
MAKVQVVTLGADPEFELIVDGAIVSASSVLRADIHLPWGSIGVDGAGSPLELRPKPSTKPSILVKNVGRLLLAVPKAIGGVPSTACEYYSIGGHIHIGNLPRNTSYDNLVEAVDDGLGDIFYDLNTRVRINAGYGKREEWRPQPWGVEYRTPPAAIWSHPEVAFTFTEAIRWMVDKLLAGENPLRSDEWASIRSAAQQAADFARRYNGRLHWGAWKAVLGEIDYIPYLGVKVHYDSGERDKTFLGDIHAMCARLGLASVRIVSLRQSRGDYASNVPGYGTLVEGFSTFTPGGTLCLSWRFRNDPEFRKVELPKLEAAIAAILRNSSEGNDGGRLVKEVVHLLPAGLPSEADEEEPVEEMPQAQSDVRHRYEDFYVCEGCGRDVHVEDVFVGRSGYAYCPDCYHDRYTRCERCDREVHRDDAYYSEDNYGPYCESCYSELYVRCDHCEAEVYYEDSYTSDSGYVFCEGCYNELFTPCTRCDAGVRSNNAYYYDDEAYCERCFEDLFTMCEHCAEFYPNDDVDYVSVRRGDGRIREMALCRYCREESYRYDEEDDVWVGVV